MGSAKNCCAALALVAVTQGMGRDAAAKDAPMVVARPPAPIVAVDAPGPASVKPPSPQLTPALVNYLQKRQLVALCAPPLPDSVDLQPGPPTGSAPCLVVADCDGDGVDDVAVLIAQAKGTKRAGLLIETKAGVIQFGAGLRTRWTKIDDDRKSRVVRAPADILARASLRSLRGLVSPPIQLAPKGVVLAISGGDAAMAIFSDGKRWYTYHLGF